MIQCVNNNNIPHPYIPLKYFNWNHWNTHVIIIKYNTKSSINASSVRVHSVSYIMLNTGNNLPKSCESQHMTIISNFDLCMLNVWIWKIFLYLRSLSILYRKHLNSLSITSPVFHTTYQNDKHNKEHPYTQSLNIYRNVFMYIVYNVHT